MKPRAYDRKNKYMFYFDDLDTDGEYGYLCFSSNNDDWEKNLYFGRDIENYDITWSTGFKDKKKKVIYVGDILEYSIENDRQQSPYIVKSAGELYHDINLADSYYRINEKSLKIIGNIFEDLK
jgi:hypothetical protein